MAAASHGDEEVALSRETNGGTDVGGAGTPRDQPGMTIDRTVPDRTGRVVLCFPRTDELSTEVHKTPPDWESGSDHQRRKEQKMDLLRPGPFGRLEPG